MSTKSAVVSVIPYPSNKGIPKEWNNLRISGLTNLLYIWLRRAFVPGERGNVAEITWDYDSGCNGAPSAFPLRSSAPRIRDRHDHSDSKIHVHRYSSLRGVCLLSYLVAYIDGCCSRTVSRSNRRHCLYQQQFTNVSYGSKGRIRAQIWLLVRYSRLVLLSEYEISKKALVVYRKGAIFTSGLIPNHMEGYPHMPYKLRIVQKPSRTHRGVKSNIMAIPH